MHRHEFIGDRLKTSMNDRHESTWILSYILKESDKKTVEMPLICIVERVTDIIVPERYPIKPLSKSIKGKKKINGHYF